MDIVNKVDFRLDYDIIVFCHLRWDFVYQRPQHIITRLSEKYKILVVEEPVQEQNQSLKIKEINSQLHVLQPDISDIQTIGVYLKKILKQRNFPVSWFYSAAFAHVLDVLDFDLVVYDCMDELSLFKGASEKLIEEENYLLSAADVVFTGGKSLYEAKKLKHTHVFCFPSSVDVAHFSSGLNSSRPEDFQNINSPIIGYFGVIDERIDLDLIKNTADKLPDYAFVMIGPICKIEETDLPRAENIYYLGMKSYEELPQYLNAFDFAMMPFALNDATKFISPTKTLEYMAGDKPIISTKIKDVVRDYSDCVNLVENSDDFCKAVKNPIVNYTNHYKEIIDRTSWDITVEKMDLILSELV